MLTAEQEQTEQLPDVVMPACPVQKILKGQKALASDQADYIHGASIFVDGGMTLYPGFEAGG